MSTETANYGFVKPATTEKYNVTDYNANLDKIDSEIKIIADQLPYAALEIHKVSHDHDIIYFTKDELLGGSLDGRYFTETEINNNFYTKSQLNAGQLDNRYFTKTEVLSGAADTRYYTKAQIDAANLGLISYPDAQIKKLRLGGVV